MITRLIPITAIALLILGGCEESPSDTAQDVSDARTEAAENISAAREDANTAIISADRDVTDAQQDFVRTDARAINELEAAEAAAMITTAHANFEVAEAEAEGRNGIAKEKCGALTGVEQDACLSGAEAVLAAEMAEATAIRDAALVAADRR